MAADVEFKPVPGDQAYWLAPEAVSTEGIPLLGQYVELVGVTPTVLFDLVIVMVVEFKKLEPQLTLQYHEDVAYCMGVV